MPIKNIEGAIAQARSSIQEELSITGTVIEKTEKVQIGLYSEKTPDKLTLLPLWTLNDQTKMFCEKIESIFHDTVKSVSYTFLFRERIDSSAHKCGSAYRWAKYHFTLNKKEDGTFDGFDFPLKSSGFYAGDSPYNPFAV